MIKGNIYSNRHRYKKVFINALICNAALAILKLGIALIGYSKLVLMDGVFAVANTVVLFLMWHGDGVEKKESCEEHPYGYGKALFLITSMAGLMVLIMSIYMFSYSIISMTWLEIHRSHSGAMMVIIISIVANQVLYRYLMDESKRFSNNILSWNAVNNRINAVASTFILICIVLASNGVDYIERVGVAVVSIILFCLGLRILFESFAGIMDKLPAARVLNQIRSCAKRVKGVKEVLDIKARYIGTALYVDLWITVDEKLAMIEADGIVRNVEVGLINKVDFTREVNVVLA